MVWQKEQDENSSSSVDLESKDLSDLIDKLSKRYPEVSFAKLSRIVVAATKWQKSQDQQTIELAEEHAMLAGMMQERERMMKDAIEGQVERDYCEDGISEHFEVFAYLSGRDERFKDLSDGQSVKVIIIKE